MIIWMKDDDLKFWAEADNGYPIFAYMCFAPQNEEDLVRLKEFVESFGHVVEWDREEEALEHIKQAQDREGQDGAEGETRKLDVPEETPDTGETAAEEVKREMPKILYGPASGFAGKKQKVDPEAMCGVYGPAPGYTPTQISPPDIQSPKKPIPKVYGPAPAPRFEKDDPGKDDD